MKKRKFGLLLSAIVASLFLFLFIASRSLTVPYNTDEISWFFHTEFFEELFIHKNTSGDIWKVYDAYDHPPLAKYLFGAYLHSWFPGVGVDRAMLKAEYGRWSFYSNQALYSVETSPFGKYIARMRDVSIVATFVVVVCIVAIALYYKIKILFCIFLVALLLQNTLFLHSLLGVQPDAIMTALFFLSLFSFFQFVGRQKLRYLLYACLFAGLSISTKLTAITLLPTYTCYVICSGVYSQKSFLWIFQRLVIIFYAIVVPWIAINPTVYTSPVQSSVFYFETRFDMLKFLQRKNSFQDINANYFTLQDRAKAVYCTIFQPQCKSAHSEGHSFQYAIANIALFVLGVYYMAKKIITGVLRWQYISLGVLFILTFAITTAFLFYNAQRYYLHMVILTVLLQCFGFQYIYEVFRPAHKAYTHKQPRR